MTTLTIPGFSAAAQILKESEQLHSDRQQEAMTFSRQPAIDAVCDAWLACQAANWDGENSLPISKSTFETTCRLIAALPHGFPSPTVAAEPDGHLDLEWYKHPRRTLSVSVSPKGTLHWAALIGTENLRGSCPFFDEIPETLLYWIGRVCAG